MLQLKDRLLRWLFLAIVTIFSVLRNDFITGIICYGVGYITYVIWTLYSFFYFNKKNKQLN